MRTLRAGVFSLALLGLSNIGYASTVFSDDFSDGNTNGWLDSTTGGSGSIGVESHNASEMAFVHHTGSGLHSISRDFVYVPSEILSFVMHAVAKQGVGFGTPPNAMAGVSISFLNAFNQSLGSLRLVNSSAPAFLLAKDIPVDQLQHSNSLSMATYAAVVGLGAADPIAKLNLSFFSLAETQFFGVSSDAEVWFDQVKITTSPTTTPLPPGLSLLLSGIASLALIKRKREAE